MLVADSPPTPSSQSAIGPPLVWVCGSASRQPPACPRPSRGRSCCAPISRQPHPPSQRSAHRCSLLQRRTAVGWWCALGGPPLLLPLMRLLLLLRPASLPVSPPSPQRRLHIVQSAVLCSDSTCSPPPIHPTAELLALWLPWCGASEAPKMAGMLHGTPSASPSTPLSTAVDHHHHHRCCCQQSTRRSPNLLLTVPVSSIKSNPYSPRITLALSRALPPVKLQPCEPPAWAPL